MLTNVTDEATATKIGRYFQESDRVKIFDYALFDDGLLIFVEGNIGNALDEMQDVTGLKILSDIEAENMLQKEEKRYDFLNSSLIEDGLAFYGSRTQRIL
jgi:hypothetical protein